MTSGRPAGPAREKKGVIDVADQDRVIHGLPLEVTLQAKRLVSLLQQPLIDRAVRGMTGGAAFTDRLVFKDKRPALGDMTLKADIVLTQEGQPTTVHMLGHACASPFHHVALVWFMTIRATHLAFDDGVTMRQLKLRANIEVTLQAGLR